ncbi:MAG: YtzI protein [Bacillus sp. (in: firmicutes)]
MMTILIISIIIIFLVIIITALTTSKAYQFKHTIDPLPNEKNSESIDKK